MDIEDFKQLLIEALEKSFEVAYVDDLSTQHEEVLKVAIVSGGERRIELS